MSKIRLLGEKNYKINKKHIKKCSIVGLPQQINRLNYDVNEKYKARTINFLVFAGSQGSFEILNIFKKIVNELKLRPLKKKIKFIVQSPLQKQNEIKILLKEKNINFEIKDFFKNFDKILNDSHIALCRSGSGTINDLINYKIPAILLPLSHAKDNHQYENAKVLSDVNCAMIIDKHKKNLEEVMCFVNKVIDDKNFNKSLITNYEKFTMYNASELMWNTIQNDQ